LQPESNDMGKIIALMPDLARRYMVQVINLVNIRTTESVTRISRAKAILRRVPGEIVLQTDKDRNSAWAVKALEKMPLIQEISRTNGFPLTLVAGA
jgi:hypothetical protein